jgi:hypothetical protein
MTNINEVLGESTLSKSFCARVLIAQSCSSPQFCLPPVYHRAFLLVLRSITDTQSLRV